ncbi:MAG: T9SS type A sorting domain-containing protein [Bacteroidia bacterium]|nr:T9SS type A sorting domain-containing protein [Bacteroidia bacterium]
MTFQNDSMKPFLFAVLVCFQLSHLPVSAQPFLRPLQGKEPSFRAMQRSFQTWKDTADLKQARYWKYFKRWEAELQLHTNAQGEPEGFKEYLDVLVQSAREKENAQRLKANSGNWYPVGPYTLPSNLTGYMENGMGRVNCISFHPSDPNTYYVGVAQGGLWKTSNGGQTYTPLTDQLPITRISDIAIDPQNPDHIYISVCDFEYIGFGLFLNGRKRHTHYGLGVYKSTDGGLSWAPTGLSFQLTDGDASLIRKIIIDPSNSSTLVACGVSGMYKSVNGGNNWTQVHDSLFWDLVQDVSNPSVLYAASGWVESANTGSAGIYKSTDFGSSWTLLPTGILPRGVVQRIKLAQAPSSPNRLYAITVDTLRGLHAIYRSDDSGSTWYLKYNTLNLLDGYDGSGSGGQGTYDLALLVHPTDPDKVYVGGINLWASDDGCNSFDPAGYWTTSYGPSIHADVHEIKYQPATGYYYLCCDGGLYRSTAILPISWNDLNNGSPFPTVWTNVSDGMNVTSFYRLSSSKSSTAELLAGAQDNASFYFDGTDWYTVNGGDGMDNYVDTLQPGTFLSSSQYGYFSFSNDGGFSNSGINANVLNENAEWTTPLIADYNTYNTLYIGFENVVKSQDGGQSWTAISGFPSPPNFYGNELSALAVSHSNPDVLIAARRVRYEYANPGSVFRTANGGLSWTDVTAGLPDSLYYTAAEIDRSNADIAFISMAGFSAGNKVFKTLNSGNSWINISYNLPNIPVNCIKQVPGTLDLVIATDIGVYLLQSGSSTWQSKSSGLPNVIVSDIEFNPALNKMYISTFGRGIWATDLDVFTGMEENDALVQYFELHPTLNFGQFSMRNPLNQDAACTLYNVEGRVISELSLPPGERAFSLNLPSGLYFLKIRAGTRFEVKRMIVSR